MARYLAQPYDFGLSAISDLSTSSFGRFLLTFQSGDEVCQYIGAVSSLVGKASVIRVYNDTNVSFPKGSAVRLTGMFGDQATVALAQAVAGGSTRTVIGLVSGDVPGASTGLATTFGLVQDLNTSALVEGALVYLSADVAGGLTSVESDAPDYNLSLGLCVKSHATTGAIFVAVSSVGDLSSLSNVSVITPADGQVLKYDAATQVWKNAAGTVNLATNATGVLSVLNGGTGVTTSTGTTNVVLSNSPTLVNPSLGTPLILIGTNITGTAAGLTAGTVTTNANLTGAVTSSGSNDTVLGSFTSAQLYAAVTDRTGTGGAAVFAISPTLVTPLSNTLSAIPVASGAGNSVTIAAGPGVGTGAGGSLILQAGIQATSGGDGKVIVRQVSGQTSNLQEWQNNAATPVVLAAFDSSGRLVVGKGISTVGVRFQSHEESTQNINYFTTGAGSNVTNYFSTNLNGVTRDGIIGFDYNANVLKLIHGTSFGNQSAGLNINSSNNVGLGTVVPLAKLHAVAGAAATKGLIVQGAASQTANLQEWQDSAGTVLGAVNSAGYIYLQDVYPAVNIGVSASNGINLHAGAIGFTVSGVQLAAIAGDTGGIWINPSYSLHWGTGRGSRDLTLNRDAHNMLGQRNGVTAQTFSAYNTYTSSSNYERAVLCWNTTANVLTIGAQAGSGGGTLRNVNIAGGNVGIGTTTISAKTHIVTVAATKGLIVQGAASQTANLQEWQNSAGTVLASVSAEGNIATNTLSAVPVASGAGNSLTIAAGAGVGTGAGGSLILQAGLQATSGGDGKVIVKQVSGQTSNLQEWQTSASGGTLKTFINNGGLAYLPSGSLFYNQLTLASNGLYKGILVEDIAPDGRIKLRHSDSGSAIEFWHGNTAIQLVGCAGNNMYLSGLTRIGTAGDAGGSQATLTYSDGITPQGRSYFYGRTYASSTNHPIVNFSYNGYEFNTAVNASWNGGQTGGGYGSLSFGAIGHAWYFAAALSSVKPLIVKGAASQTANLQEWQNSAGTVLASVSAEGNIATNTLSAIPIVSGLTASVTAASSSGGILTYTATNTFTVGRTVSVTGLTIASGTTLNIAGMTIATASASQFTVVNATVGVSSGTGTATAGGNTLADAASNAVTAGPGGNRVITAGSGAGVGKGGDIILQPGAQATSGGNGVTVFKNTSGVEKARVLESGQFISSTAGVGFGWSAAGASSITHGLRCNNPGHGFITIQGQGNNVFSVDSNNGQTSIAAPSSSPNWRLLLVNALNSESTTGEWALSCSASNGVAIVRDGSVSIAGGSFSFPSSTTAIATNQNDLILTGSAFQRINCTTASNLTGIAPPTGGTHVDGRMIRVYNVGAANLTLVHNATSTAANRFFNSTLANIILAQHDYAELIYDITDNGSIGPGWRVA